MGLGLLFQTLGSPCQSSRSISQESRCNPEAQLCAATAAAPKITARGGISSALASWNLGKTSYVERITEMQSYNKPRHGRLGGTAAIHWMLQCRGRTVRINRPGYRPGLPCGWTSSTGQPAVPEAVFPGNRLHQTLVFRGRNKQLYVGTILWSQKHWYRVHVCREKQKQCQRVSACGILNRLALKV